MVFTRSARRQLADITNSPCLPTSDKVLNTPSSKLSRELMSLGVTPAKIGNFDDAHTPTKNTFSELIQIVNDSALINADSPFPDISEVTETPKTDSDSLPTHSKEGATASDALVLSDLFDESTQDHANGFNDLDISLKIPTKSTATRIDSKPLQQHPASSLSAQKQNNQSYPSSKTSPMWESPLKKHDVNEVQKSLLSTAVTPSNSLEDSNNFSSPPLVLPFPVGQSAIVAIPVQKSSMVTTSAQNTFPSSLPTLSNPMPSSPMPTTPIQKYIQPTPGLISSSSDFASVEIPPSQCLPGGSSSFVPPKNSSSMQCTPLQKLNMPSRSHFMTPPSVLQNTRVVQNVSLSAQHSHPHIQFVAPVNNMKTPLRRCPQKTRGVHSTIKTPLNVPAACFEVLGHPSSEEWIGQHIRFGALGFSHVKVVPRGTVGNFVNMQERAFLSTTNQPLDGTAYSDAETEINHSQTPIRKFSLLMDDDDNDDEDDQKEEFCPMSVQKTSTNKGPAQNTNHTWCGTHIKFGDDEGISTKNDRQQIHCEIQTQETTTITVASEFQKQVVAPIHIRFDYSDDDFSLTQDIKRMSLCQ